MEKLKKCSKCGPQPIPTLYLWNECTTRYDGARSLTNMEILVI